MRLREVREWARARGIRAAEFRRVHDAALLHVISRVLQAMYRESRHARLARDARGGWQLTVGRGLRLPASGPLPFRRLEITASRWRSPGGFLRALRRALAGTRYARVFEALRSDFANSHANVVLNRLIGPALGKKAHAIEPAWQGHQYYPLPALRIGPSLKQVLDCSHLCREAVQLPMLHAGSSQLISVRYGSYEAFFRAWSGLEPQPGEVLLPAHPWQVRLSPIARELPRSTLTVEAIPLASQRTCRVVRTGFDLKLPVDARITGERRLLYRLNCVNAPAVSALAKHALGKSGLRALGFQLDVASMMHSDPDAAPHLSVIVRPPVLARPGERIVPAINLWSGRHEARRLLRGADPERFFRHYCRTLMSGPVVFCSQWGMAFEPHLQNVYVALRGGLPVRVVLRDLDNTILEARRIRPLARALGVALAHDTWRHMPAFEIGGQRMIQAMLYGHLGEVMLRLVEDHGAAAEELRRIVEETWDELEAAAASRAGRVKVQQLRGWSDVAKATLRSHLRRSNAVEFVRG